MTAKGYINTVNSQMVSVGANGVFHLHKSHKAAKSMAKLISQLCGELQLAVCWSRGEETIKGHPSTRGHLISFRNK